MDDSYVLVAYLQGGLVEQLGWLNQTQLLGGWLNSLAGLTKHSCLMPLRLGSLRPALC